MLIVVLSTLAIVVIIANRLDVFFVLDKPTETEETLGSSTWFQKMALPQNLPQTKSGDVSTVRGIEGPFLNLLGKAFPKLRLILHW